VREIWVDGDFIVTGIRKGIERRKALRGFVGACSQLESGKELKEEWLRKVFSLRAFSGIRKGIESL